MVSQKPGTPFIEILVVKGAASQNGKTRRSWFHYRPTSRPIALHKCKHYPRYIQGEFARRFRADSVAPRSVKEHVQIIPERFADWTLNEELYLCHVMWIWQMLGLNLRRRLIPSETSFFFWDSESKGVVLNRRNAFRESPNLNLHATETYIPCWHEASSWS